MDHQQQQKKNSVASNFPANSFPPRFAGLNNVVATPNNVVTSPLFMSLQQLSDLSSGAVAAGFLPGTNQLSLGSQFTNDFANASWNAQCQQTASWIDQANKMAAILPMYSALQTAVTAGDQSNISSMMEQNLKNQAAVAAAACIPSPLLFPSHAMGGASQNAPVSTPTSSGSSHQRTSSQASMGSPALPPTSNGQQRWGGGGTPLAGNTFPHSASTSSHPPSNETIAVGSPMNCPYSLAQQPHQQFSPAKGNNNNHTYEENMGRKHAYVAGQQHVATSSSVHVNNPGELPALDLHDFSEYLIDRAKECGRESDARGSTSNPSNEHQAEELANADMELDRLVSLVARQNDAQRGFPQRTTPTTTSIFNFDAFRTPPKPFGDGGVGHALNPAQFTPPDSPTHPTQQAAPPMNEVLGRHRDIKAPHGSPAPISVVPAITPSFTFPSPTNNRSKTCSTPSSSSTSIQSNQPSTPLSVNSPQSTLPLVFIPKLSPINKSPLKSSIIGRPAIVAQGGQSSRVPIYKSGKSSVFAGSGSSQQYQEKDDDAFSFTDDEVSEAPLIPQLTKTSSKIGKQNSQSELRSVYLSTAANAENTTAAEISKHIVPKKRHLIQSIVDKCEELVVPCSQTPSASISNEKAEALQVNTQSKLACLIRERRNKRFDFLRSEFLEDNDSAAPDVIAEEEPEIEEQPAAICSIKVEEPDDNFDISQIPSTSKASPRPSLPKLVIKLLVAKKEPEPEIMKVKKKEKKKRKKKDRDREWEGSKKDRHHKKKKHKKHKKEKRRHSTSFETHQIELDEANNGECEKTNRRLTIANGDMAMFSKKRRLISQWQENEENHPEASSSHATDNNFVTERANSSFENAFVSQRLRCLARADRKNLPKGTFLVVKEEAFKPDCPLWKVDNQNLLQKYLPLLNGDSIRRYRNSSTYAGWCEQIADDYLVVEIKYVKHSRSENIIEPLVPIEDLIPAVSSEMAGETTVCEEERVRAVDEYRVGDGTLKSHLHTFVQAMLKHATSLNFLQTVKSSNDWNYLCAMNEIEQRNLKTRERITNKMKWTSEFENDLHKYSNLSSVDVEMTSNTCQVCENCEPCAALQLFGKEIYDYESLIVQDKTLTNSHSTCSPLPAVEYLVCSSCRSASKCYHRIYHMKYHVFKQCENMLESISEENHELNADAVIQQCLGSKSWLQKLINDCAELWRKAEEFGT